MPTSHRLSIAEERQQAEYNEALQKAQRTGSRMTIDTRGRPVLPPYPLLTGVAGFPFTSGVPSRWIVLTFTLVIWGWLLTEGVYAWISWGGGNAGVEAAFAGLVETIIALPIAVVWYAAVSSIVIAIFSQTAVGARRIEDWPSLNFIHSMGEMFPLGIAVTFCATLAGRLGTFLQMSCGKKWCPAGLRSSSVCQSCCCLRWRAIRPGN